MSQTRSIRLANSEELPGELTAEAMGTTSRNRGARLEGPGMGGTSRKALEQGGAPQPRRWEEEGKAVKPAQNPQAIDGICIARQGAMLRFGEGQRKQEALRRGGERERAEEAPRVKSDGRRSLTGWSLLSAVWRVAPGGRFPFFFSLSLSFL
jgi:hypothetical protein